MSLRRLAVLLGTVAAMISAPTIAAPQAPKGTLLVCNKGDHSVGFIDPAQGKQVATVPDSGITVHEIVATGDGRLAFAPVYGNSGVGKPGSDGSTIDVIDIRKQRRVATINLGHAARPHCPIVGPKDGLIYVTTELTHSITIIDPKTLKVVGSIPTAQPESHMLALSHDGKRGYTANVGPGTVSVLDIAHRKNLGVIHVSPQVQRIAVSMDDQSVFTADQTQPRLAVIDAKTKTVKSWIALPTLAYGTAPTPDGRWLLVALPDANQVGVVDLHTMRVARSVAVGKYPQEIVVTPDGSTAFVSCMSSRQVAQINLHTWKVEQLIPAGKTDDGLAWVGAR
jgi:YVTN family beta-propeller protein